jgi:hypothetical protein
MAITREDRELSERSKHISAIDNCDINAMNWSDEDLNEILQHQIRTPLMEELQPEPGNFELVNLLSRTGNQARVATFGDLLTHSNPSLILLKAAKDFAKMAAGPSDDALPKQVAAALYILLNAAAIVRLNQKITTFDDAEWRQNLHWLMAQSWIELPMRNLAKEALDTSNCGNGNASAFKSSQ